MFHTMRHSWASWQMQAGHTTEEAPGTRRLGSTLEMPLRYAHLDPSHLAEYADRSLLQHVSREKSVKVAR
jgi:hypothetical protein